jgi:hypothetical protein
MNEAGRICGRRRYRFAAARLVYRFQEGVVRRCLTALFVLFIGCLAATQALAERRVALVVGNSQYAYTSTLPNPRNDAEDIAGALARVGFEVTVGYDLDQIKFAGIVAEFARALDGADVGLFFYAGHGLQIDGKNYLVSTHAKLENTFLVSSETMELDNIIRMMESKAGISLVFLDACRNNPLADNLKRNIAAVNRSLSVGRGLAPIAPGQDTLVAFSAASGEVAADGGGRNSPFAASLLRHVTQPGIEISVMLKEVTADVRQATNNVQRPQQFSDMSKTFYFVKAEQAAAAAPSAVLPPPAAPADPVEVAFWQSAAAANECDSIRAYLRRYPNGRFDDLAVIAERRLCRAGPEVAAVPQGPPAPAPAAAPVPPPAAPNPASAAPPPATAPAPPASSVATAPADALPSATPIARPVVAPDVADIGRRLQKELARVGCAPAGMETDGTWSAASRTALRQFNERTHAVAVLERPTSEALEAAQGHKDRVCPLACEPGTELRGGSCVQVHKERTRNAARPSERERLQEREHPARVQRFEPREPRSAGGGPRPPTREENQTLDPKKGESWTYLPGGKRCKTYQPMGETPRIICP